MLAFGCTLHIALEYTDGAIPYQSWVGTNKLFPNTVVPVNVTASVLKGERGLGLAAELPFVLQTALLHTVNLGPTFQEPQSHLVYLSACLPNSCLCLAFRLREKKSRQWVSTFLMLQPVCNAASHGFSNSPNYKIFRCHCTTIILLLL